MTDALGDTDGQHPLALESAAVDVLVGGDDDAVRLVDIVVREHVLGADGSLGLHLHLDTEPLRGLRQLLRGHVRVGDACRTGRHRKQLHLPLPARRTRHVVLS
jgi:hypothetical protein